METVLHSVGDLARSAGGDELRAAANGRLLVDVASFSALDTVSLRGARQGPTLNILESSGAHAIRCRPFRGGCHIRDNGLFVHLDSLEVFNPNAFAATVTYWWTDRRHSGASAIGFVKLHLEFRKSQGVWRLIEREVIDIT